jgi:hypothetical protein
MGPRFPKEFSMKFIIEKVAKAGKGFLSSSMPEEREFVEIEAKDLAHACHLSSYKMKMDPAGRFLETYHNGVRMYNRLGNWYPEGQVPK